MLDSVQKAIEATSPFLAAYPTWVKLLFVSWGMLTAVLVLSLIVVQRNGLTTGVVGAAPPAIGVDSADSRDKLRSARGLRALRDIENELPLSELPRGVYGFVVPWAVAHHDMTLHQQPGGTVTLEVQKLSGGEVHLIGFVSQESAIVIESGEGGSVKLFVHAWEEARTIGSVPLSRIVSANKRGFRDDYVIDIKLLPR